LINDCKGNTKELWNAMKQTQPSSKASSSITNLSVDGALLTSAQSIVSALNSFFVNIGRELANTVDLV
jgi:hypothetical protein